MRMRAGHYGAGSTIRLIWMFYSVYLLPRHGVSQESAFQHHHNPPVMPLLSIGKPNLLHTNRLLCQQSEEQATHLNRKQKRHLSVVFPPPSELVYIN